MSSEKKAMVGFLEENNVCKTDIEWAVQNCSSLREVWETAEPSWLVRFATRPGVLTDREQHEFGLWCANQVRHLMTDERSVKALDVKRLWLDDKATDNELWVANNAATWTSNGINRIARNTIGGALRKAEADNWAARIACWATDSSTSVVARVATGVNWVIQVSLAGKQAEWLRKNITPKF